MRCSVDVDFQFFICFFQNPNKSGNSFNNLFGDSDGSAANGNKKQGQGELLSGYSTHIVAHIGAWQPANISIPR